MDIDFDDLERRTKKDGLDIELFRAYIISVDRLANDPELLNSDEALDHTILSFYTWKRAEMIKEAALEKNLPENHSLFEPFNGTMHPKQRNLLEPIADPDPILNYHVAGLAHAAERVKQFAARFGATTPLNKLLKNYIQKGKVT